MFAPQVASQPPSSRDSPRLCPQLTRSELEGRQLLGSEPPVFTPSLHRSLRKDHEEAGAGAAARQAAIFFRPRTSILDYTELMCQGSDHMRGLVTCFWTVVGAYLVSLLFAHYERSGEIMSRGLAGVIFSRAADLVISDLALVASTAAVVPMVHLLWVGGAWRLPALLDPRHQGRGRLVQAAFEVAWLAAWYVWLGTRGWPWAQRCFFALHTVVNWMKVHSYLSSNRRLACALRDVADLRAQRKRQSDSADSADSAANDAEIDAEIDALDAMLCPYTTRFPANLTLANYAMFQLSPALVYELEYPRTERIRWSYMAEKLVGTAGIFVVFYVVVAHLVIPHLERMPETGVFVATLHLMGPMATCWLLFFFITFDSIANGFAELTRFADRRFYDDWWNARGLDEFSRKWNRPVHMFLARHIYMPVRESWHPGHPRKHPRVDDAHAPRQSSATVMSRLRQGVPPAIAAMAATFFFSSILHEVTIVMACQRWNHALFFFSQMMQIPLIICSEKFHWLKSQQALRNWAFWLSMVTFQPFLLCLYTYQAFAYSSSSRSLDVISGTMSVMVVTNATNMA